MERTNKTRKKTDPIFWVKQAHSLDKAAMLIWQAIHQDMLKMEKMPKGEIANLSDYPFLNLSGVFWLNAGFALENLFKAVILQNKQVHFENGVFPKKLKDHNLIRLCHTANIELNVIEAYYLHVATQSIVWSGRYPCSINPKTTDQRVFSESDIIAYKGLFTKIHCQIDTNNMPIITYIKLA